MSDNQKIITILWFMGSLESVNDKELKELMLLVSHKLMDSLKDSDKRFLKAELGGDIANG